LGQIRVLIPPRPRHFAPQKAIAGRPGLRDNIGGA
jgi:hypothetical protein